MENEMIPNLKGLKICFIAGTLGMGGAEKQLYYILRSLVAQGANVSLISLSTGEHWEQPIKDLGVHYYFLKGKTSKPARIWAIRGLLNKLKPEIVQSQHFYTNLYAATGAWFCGAKSVGASRSELKVEIRLNGRFGMPSFRWPQYFVLNSMLSVSQAIELGKLKSHVFYLPNALDTEKFSQDIQYSSIEKKQLTILTIGRMTIEKRFDLFIELISNLHAKYGDRIKGQLIGDGKLSVELKELAAKRGLGERELEFVQKTDRPEDYLKQADFFVLTSEFEGTPNVVLEAMACGLPVVTTKVGNLQYFIKDGENAVFSDNETEELSEKMVALIEDKDRCIRLSSNAVKTVNEWFSIEQLGKNLSGIYLQIRSKKQ